MALISTDVSETTIELEIEQLLGRLIEGRQQQAAIYGSEFVRLWGHAAECLRGGKLIRPRVLVGAFDALVTAPSSTGGADRSSVLEIAAATELLHYAFLLHDDVIDGDIWRRHRLNLVGRLSADYAAHHDGIEEPDRGAHWGLTGGILMGDLMLAQVHQVFARVNVPSHHRLRLLDLLDETITDSVAGEYLDVGLSDSMIPAELSTVLSMSKLKTATYTFSMPLRAAAILAGFSAETEQVLGDVGQHVGLAFQLQDDLLSVFGDPAEHGKDAFSDLREGKETAIIAYARLTSAWPSLEPLFGRADLSAADGALACRLLRECGAERFVSALVDEQLRATSERLSEAAHVIPQSASAFIARVTSKLEGRCV